MDNDFMCSVSQAQHIFFSYIKFNFSKLQQGCGKVAKMANLFMRIYILKYIFKLPFLTFIEYM